jgi:ribonucleoside-triphosphate reductase (thioredoxin)
MPLPTPYQEFIHLSRYSRWLEEKGRRETWEETISRYFDFFIDHLAENTNYKVSKKERKELETLITEQSIMPSMRSLMTAGEALKRDNVAGYNCAYVSAGRVRSFDEILYILMCGTGVGFSVERGFLDKLATISEEFEDSDTTIVVQDSKLGWAKAYKELTSLLIGGQIPVWDLTKVRPAGERLKTFGGRSSGPEPLDDLFRFTVATYKGASGRKLTSLECHDIICKIAEVVVVGGVRRSALISLSSLTDERMREAKTGQWWYENGQRTLANNSVAYKNKPEIGTFMDEWISLYKSKSGERGIFNREAAKKTVEKLGDRRDPNYDFGTNPCSEIILRDREFCNLTEVVVRSDDTIETLKEKVKFATILGTWQSTLTNFRYLSSEWKKNCEEERLLGVSLTGIMDNDLTNGRQGNKILISVLEELKQVAIETNKEYAKKLKINPSAAITCVKPSGTVSQLVDAASGIHARHSDYYVRTVRADNKDPLCQFMKDKGFPYEACVMKPEHVTVFSFPVNSPSASIKRDEMSAIEQLENWLIYQQHWCEHKPSITVTIREEEWMEVGAWVYKHFDEVCGVSFLPHSDHVYKQAPYQECTKMEYEELSKKMPKDINWIELKSYEENDNTSGSQTFACSGNSCEIVDITTA